MQRRRLARCTIATLLVGAAISQVSTASADASAPLVRVSEGAPLAPQPVQSSGRWVATWTAGPVPPASHGRSAMGFTDQTVRQDVRISVGGSEVRVRFTNAFGTRPLEVSAADLAMPSTGADLVPGTDRGLTVDGARAFTVPAGATVATDPVDVPVGAGADLAVSAWFSGPTGPATWHPLALGTGYLATGDHVADDAGGAFQGTTPSWWYLDGVDVLAPRATRAVVAFGASTSDGEGSPPGAHARWVDDLNRRLAASDPDLGVVDEGIAGNRLLSADSRGGPSGEDRFDMDAVAQPGVGAVIVSSLGNDDIGHQRNVTAADLIAGYRRIIAAGHAAGLRVVGATLTPDRGAGMWTAAGEQVREQVNAWILSSHAFDATIDFARVVADPAHPDRLAGRFDSGDHLHPNAKGYAAIAAVIDPTVLSGPAA